MEVFKFPALTAGISRAPLLSAVSLSERFAARFPFA